jgi:hypothetical protein
MNFSNLISVISVRDNKNEHDNGASTPITVPNQDDDFFPLQILDIKLSNSGYYKFFVLFIGLKTRSKKQNWIKSINLMGKETRNFLLGKFFSRLSELMVHGGDPVFVEERLKLLKDFAASEGIDLVDVQLNMLQNEKNHRKFKPVAKSILRKSGLTSKNKRVKTTQVETGEMAPLKKTIQKASSTNSLKKKIEFIKKNVLKEIKQMQDGLKEVTYLNKKSFFKCLDSISANSASMYKEEFKLHQANA